ncbi:MAG: Inositol-1-monophosphatase [Candidatus Heimdallarchaeota archaeon LC_3]|nr:MAG: Inositol-1-monophosphatase [Candidatus Heimdallarchaeota archaeon LC_3]
MKGKIEDKIIKKIRKAVIETGNTLNSFKNSEDSFLFEYKDKNMGGQNSLGIDLIAENTFVKNLNEEDIGGIVLSEEKGEINLNSKDNPITFILDPLDGSSNFIRKLPFSCVSVAINSGLEEFDFSSLHYGFVFDFLRNDLFEINNDKVLLNGKSIKYNKKTGTPAIVLYTYKSEGYKLAFEFEKWTMIRTLGASALELSLVATGALDGFVDIRLSLKTYDFAVGARLINLLGGRVTFFDKNEIIPNNKVILSDFTKGYGILASSDEKLYDLILKEISNKYLRMFD